jgi:hypothetical protein
MGTYYRFGNAWLSKLTAGTAHINEALNKIQHEAAQTEALYTNIMERYCSTLSTMYDPSRTPAEVTASVALLQEVTHSQGDRAEALFKVS